MRIRVARIDDAPQISRGEWATAATPGMLVGRPGEIPEHAFRAKLSALVPLGCYWVADVDDVIAGHAFLEPMGMLGTSHVFQLNIVVHPGHTDRGIGSALMSALLSWAQQSPHVMKIELLVRATNARALHLYRKFGFVDEGRFSRRVRTADGVFIDDISMCWFPERAH